eukprot:1984177-Pleurochrysis_carterae.AAC.1
MHEHKPEFATILAFDVPVTKEAADQVPAACPCCVSISGPAWPAPLVDRRLRRDGARLRVASYAQLPVGERGQRQDLHRRDHLPSLRQGSTLSLAAHVTPLAFSSCAAQNAPSSALRALWSVGACVRLRLRANAPAPKAAALLACAVHSLHGRGEEGEAGGGGADGGLPSHLRDL